MIENERKYLVYSRLENYCAEVGKKQHIEQGYLSTPAGLTVRIRCLNGDSHHLTVKQRIDSIHVVEVDSIISSTDFAHLAKKCVSWVRKIRYKMFYDELYWDVDFFKKGEETYFSMAEVELPEGLVYPASLPFFIEENLLYAVPSEDSSRFSSKKLSDYKYAQRIMATVFQQRA